MECHEAEALLGAYLDGELEPAVSASVRAHAETCVTCRQRLADMHSIGRMVRQAPYYQAPEALRARLTQARPRSRATSHLLAWAAAVVMVVSSGRGVRPLDAALTPVVLLGVVGRVSLCRCYRSAVRGAVIRTHQFVLQ